MICFVVQCDVPINCASTDIRQCVSTSSLNTLSGWVSWNNMCFIYMQIMFKTLNRNMCVFSWYIWKLWHFSMRSHKSFLVFFVKKCEILSLLIECVKKDSVKKRRLLRGNVFYSWIDIKNKNSTKSIWMENDMKTWIILICTSGCWNQKNFSYRWNPLILFPFQWFSLSLCDALQSKTKHIH